MATSHAPSPERRQMALWRERSARAQQDRSRRLVCGSELQTRDPVAVAKSDPTADSAESEMIEQHHLRLDWAQTSANGVAHLVACNGKSAGAYRSEERRVGKECRS